MLFVAFLIALWLPVNAEPVQDRISGQWYGYWLRAGDTLAVTLNITRDAGTGKYSALFDADRLRVIGIPFTDVSVEGCCNVRMTLRGDRTTMTFSGTVRADSLLGLLRDEDGEGRFAFTRARGNALPVEEKEVTFQNGVVTLSGSLLLPQTGHRLPAVVFLHGSGAEGRWGSRYLATQFAKQGIAALIYDKRGVGKSKGDWRTASIDDLVADAVAAVAQLAQETRIDPSRIGIHGHSQGGTLAPMVAVRSGRIAFIVASAAAGTPTDSTEIFSILNSVYPRASTAQDSADARRYVSELVGVAYHGEERSELDALTQQMRGRKWFFAPPAADNSYWTFSREFARYRPLEWWKQVRVPVLLVFGAADQRVPAAQSAARISNELLQNASGADVSVRIFPGADHTFRLAPGPSGWPRTASGYLATLLDWIKKQ